MRKLTLRYAPRRAAGCGGKKANGGFTLLETLLAVAILVILMGLAMVGVARYRAHLKIAELDNAARDIYMAAENRAVLLQNSGRLGTASATLLSGSGSGDLTQLTRTVDGTEKSFRVLSEGTDADKRDALLPVGVIDPTLREKHFRVVYDEATGHVVEAFYSEEDIGADLGDYRESRSDRVSDKRMVGWYAGSAADEIGTKPLPTPGVEVIIVNGDELTLTVRYTLPADGLPAGGVKRTPSVTLRYGTEEIKLLYVDETANTVQSPHSARLKNDQDIAGGTNPLSATYTWVLDSLDTSKQFKGLTGSGIHLGDNFTVTASLTLTADGCIDSAYYATGTDNSLFAKGSTYGTVDDDGKPNGTAQIANLRHLQNLHPGHSNAGAGAVDAVQLCDIDCMSSLRNDGTVIEANYSFIPIVNESLVSYDGQVKNINRLYVYWDGHAGLFGEVKGKMDFTDVRLMDPRVTSTGGQAGSLAGLISGGELCTLENVWAVNALSRTEAGTGEPNAGGLVGAGTGEGTSVSFDGCRVYWDDTRKDELVSGSKLQWVISGYASAGGLVGSWYSPAGSVTVKNSFAATTVQDRASHASESGGLIGYVKANVTIENSYADCYLAAANAMGGLIGGSNGNVTLTNVYAAGFIVNPSTEVTAGLIGYGTANASNAYSVVRAMKMSTETEGGMAAVTAKLYKPNIPLYGAIGDGSGSVRYLYMPEEVTGGVKEALGDGFEYVGTEPETHVYNLRHKLSGEADDRLTPPYPFPGLNDLPHYSDWAELNQASAVLVYYEVYKNEAVPGVSGPGLTDTLKHDTENPEVTRDGYALMLEADAVLDAWNGLRVKYGGAQDWKLAKMGADESDANVAVEAVGDWEWIPISGTVSTTAQSFSKNADADKDKTYEVTQGDGANSRKYILVPLPDEIVTGNLPNAASTFYQQTDISPAGSTLASETNTYYFNPHFARTVEVSNPGNPVAVSVRTARHLYDLSRFQEAGESLVYAVQDYYFSQELDIDYSTYTVGYGSGFPGSIQYNGTEPFMQDPIGLGPGSGSSFKGTYDGGGRTIRSVLYNTDQTYIGLFGHSSGTLKSVVYEAEGQSVTKSGSIYMGSLAGYGDIITDCEATVKGNQTIEGVGTTYGGGMAGQAGAMENCTVTVNGNLRITGTTNTYGGGLAAHSKSTTSCTSTVKGDLTVEGRVNGKITYGGGLVGFIDDNGEKTTDCHAETTGTLTVVSVGAEANAYGGGFAGLAVRWGGTARNCSAKLGALVVSVQTTENGTGLRDAYGGGLVGRADEGSFEDCSAEAGDITVTGNGTLVYAGGLVGHVRNLKDCHTTIESLIVKGGESNTRGGGLLGRIAGDVDGCQATIGTLSVEGAGDLTCGGGLAGDTGGNLTNCTSTSKIGSVTVRGTGSGSAYGGGLVGKTDGNVIDCSNVEVANVSVEGTGSGPAYGGGLVGSAYSLNSCSHITVESVTVNGTGSGDAYGGGLVGRTTNNVEGCDITIGPLSVTGNGKLVCGGGLTGWANYIRICKVNRAKSLTIEGQGTGADAVTYGGGLAGYSTWGAGSCNVMVEEALTIRGAGGTTCGGGLVGIQNQSNQWNTDVIDSSVTVNTIDVIGTGGTIYAGGVVGRAPQHVVACIAEITSMTVTGSGGTTYAGGVAGYATENVKDNCSARITSLNVTGNNGGTTYVGGVVGQAYNVNDCFAEIASMSVAGAGAAYVGGVTGFASNYMERCGAVVAITVTGSGKAYVGGVVGETAWGVRSCYAVGKISSNNNNAIIAGLIGKVTPQSYYSDSPNSYAAVAVSGIAAKKSDFCGEYINMVRFTNCYYLNGTWTYNDEDCSALNTGNPGSVTGKNYDELAGLASMPGTEWGKVPSAEGTETYPFPVSTKDKDGNWYYPGAIWPKSN